MSYVMVCLSLVIAGVFGISAMSKVLGRASYAGFRDSVHHLGGVPARSAQLVAVAVVALELLVSAATVRPGTAPAGLGAALLMLAAFTVVLSRAVRRGTSPACHCFGAGSKPVSGRHVVRNLVLIAVAGAALAMRLLTGAPRVSAPGLLLCLLVAGVVAAGVALLDDLVALLRPVPPPDNQTAGAG